MSGTKELKALLDAKYTPETHDYCVANRRSSYAKALEGWAPVGEMTNHGEVMIVLQRIKPTPPPPEPPRRKPPKPDPEPVTKPIKDEPRPSLAQRATAHVKGGTKK